MKRKLKLPQGYNRITYLFKKIWIEKIIIENKIFSYLASLTYLYYKKEKIKMKKEEKLLITQTIFVKDNITLEKNITSLKSLGKYLKKYPPTVEYILWFSGWAYNKSSRKTIVDILEQEFNNQYIIMKFEQNVGKSTYINSIVQKISKTFERTSLFTFDSDIIFSLDCPELFDRVVYSITETEKKKKQEYWIISLAFVGLDAHLPCTTQNQRYYSFVKNNIKYLEKMRYWYICTWIWWGCWMINRKLWDKVGWYSNVWIYWPEDALLVRKCVQKWFSWQILDSARVVHPILIDEEYIKKMKI